MMDEMKDSKMHRMHVSKPMKKHDVKMKQMRGKRRGKKRSRKRG